MSTVQRSLRGLLLVIVVATMVPRLATAADDKRDAQCREFAAQVKDQRYTSADIEILSGCHRDANGSWFWLANKTDARLVGPLPLTTEERAQTESVRARITAQRRELLVSLRAIYDSNKPNFLIALTEYSEGAISAEWGLSPQMGNSIGTKNVYAVYEPILINHVTDPNNIDLGKFVYWWSARRAATIPPHIENLIPTSKYAYIEAMAFNRGPWPWELAREVTIDEYLDWALANGEIQVEPTTTPTPVTTTADDCIAMAYWLGSTTARSERAARFHSSGPLSLNPDAASAAGYRNDAAVLEQLALEQETSNPPDAARAVNALLVSSWRGFATSLRALADAGVSEDQAAWDQAAAMQAEPRKDSTAARQEITKLKELCGIAAMPSLA